MDEVFSSFRIGLSIVLTIVFGLKNVSVRDERGVRTATVV